MQLNNFLIIGENIHCSRIIKRGGSKTVALPGGGEGIAFNINSENRVLPVPAAWPEISPAYDDGKIKHVAVAVYQALNGDGDNQKAGEDYLCYLAERQIRSGAAFLDVNVDEYSTDSQEQAEIMTFLASFLSKRFKTPLSIDSSNPETLRVGLESCRQDIRPPMINSISLERLEVIDLAQEFEAEAVVNAAGREAMPADAAERIANFQELLKRLEEKKIARPRLHLDPLVLPISTDPMNGQHFLDATRQAKAEFAGVHLNGGLSNISFGMPNRRLLNLVFAYLCIEAGTDGGILDPVSTPVAAIQGLDSKSESFKMAKAVLTGEDMFGMEYITAFREGRL